MLQIAAAVKYNYNIINGGNSLLMIFLTVLIVI